MAVPVRLSNMPEHIRMPHLREVTEFQLKQTEPSLDQHFLHFPSTAYALWDGASTGSPVFLQNRQFKICLLEKVLWLLHKQCEGEDVTNKVLMGSLTVGDDAEGVCFRIDGIDTRQGNSETGMAIGDIMVPVQVSKSKNQERSGSVDDYMGAMKLAGRCSSGDKLELSSFVLLKGWFSFYEGNTDKTVAHLQFDVVTMATIFKAMPISGVPIVPTALAKNLLGPRSLSQVQGRPKSGYLTMDHTRKLLLVLESDPKVSSLPIVGIWVSGATLVHHPFVWAACIRYLHSTQIQDRVCTPPEAFLLVLYTPLHSKPEFYEVNTVSGRPDLEYSLFNGYEITSFSKKSTGPDPTNIEWEVQEICSGPKQEMFDAAFQSLKSQRCNGERQNPVIASSSTVDDDMPRSVPAPHTAKAMMVKPMVPEVSLLWNDSGHIANGLLNPSPHQHQSASTYRPLSTFSMTSPHAVQGAHANPSLARGISPVSGQRTLGDTSGQILHPGYTVFTSKSSAINHPHPNTDCANPLLFKLSTSPVTSNTLQSSKPLSTAADVTPAHKGSSFVPHARSTLTTQTNPPPVNGLIRENAQPSQLTPSLINISRPKPFPQCTQVDATASAAHRHPSAQGQMVMDHGHTTGFDLVGHQGTLHALNFTETRQPVITSPRLGDEVSKAYPHLSQAGLQPSAKGTNPHPCPQAGRHKMHSECFSRCHAPPSFMPTSPESYLCHPTCPSGPAKADGQMYTLTGHQQTPQTQRIDMHFPSSSANSEVSVPHVLNVPNMPQGIVGQQWDSTGFGSPAPAGIRMPVPPGAVAADSTASSGKSSDDSGKSSDDSGKSSDDSGKSSDDSGKSSDDSGKSSDDSGLGVTPDHSNPSPKRPTSPDMKADGFAGVGSTVASDRVPSEVLQRLKQQDAQLKQQDAQLRMLQAQIQALVAQQQQSTSQGPGSSAGITPTPPPSCLPNLPNLPNPPKKPVVETQSVAVNTTAIMPDSPYKPCHPTRCVFVQTSPTKTPSALSQSMPQQELVGQCGGGSNERYVPASDLMARFLGMSRAEKDSSGHTPEELRHQGVIELTSTRIDDGPAAEQCIRQPAAHLESTWSPSSGQLSSLSNSPSPTSTSQEEEGKAEVSPDSKEYYDQVLNNIRLFLNSHYTEDLHDQTAEVSGELENRLNMKNFVVTNSPGAQSKPSHCGSTDTTLIPRINYLSMMLDSDSNTSLEINAMAMKYLQDEQLTQLVRLHQSPAPHHNSAILRKVLAAVGGSSMADVSHGGMSSNNLTMATEQYMARHGLLGDGGESMLVSNHTIQLQTNFSLATSSESSSAPGLDSSPKKHFLDSHSPCASANKSPVKKELLRGQFQPSPVVPEEREVFTGTAGGVHDLGASPVLRPSLKHHFHSGRSKPNVTPTVEDLPLFPERYRHPCLQEIRTSECSSASDDDRILDIERLKQLPKLL